MTTETGTFTPTDEDVAAASRAICLADDGLDCEDSMYGAGSVLFVHQDTARAVLSTIGPIIERERRAAYEQGHKDGYDKRSQDEWDRSQR